VDRLTGQVQRYAWGDRELIAELQGRHPSGEPEAELWLGAHPVAPATLAGSGRSLADALAADPGGLLGPAVDGRFGQLPFLLKVLAAADPLSIQAHPSRAQAEAGFAREEAAGVAWDSPARTYRDTNHKPELICALTRFEAKCGFRPLDTTRSLVAALAGTSSGATGLTTLSRLLGTGGEPAATLRQALVWLLQLGPAEAGAMAAEVAAAAGELLAAGPLPAEIDGLSADLAWTGELHRSHPCDAGVVVALLLNHVVLEPGQALFLPAGNLHSYLRGAGVELMASSDNVVRGGLTRKHVDVDELAAIVDTRPRPPPVQEPAGPCHRFESPVPDFSLTRLSGSFDQRFDPDGPEILLVTAGSAVIELAGEARAPTPTPTPTLTLARSEAAFVSWSDGPYLVRAGEQATVWRAAAGDLDGRDLP
jgi:mannose-6-phosphate isomerase